MRFRIAVAVSLFAVALGSMRGDAQQPQQQPAQPPSQTPPGEQPPPVSNRDLSRRHQLVGSTSSSRTDGRGGHEPASLDFEITEKASLSRSKHSSSSSSMAA